MTSLIKSFLSDIQTDKWKEVAKSSINKVVMGNEACDLDSAVSSIAYAYFLQFLDKKMEFGVVYPVLNINRNDYPLRTEVNYWLNKYFLIFGMIVEPVGSCSTLVTNEIVKNNSEALDEDLSNLLYGTILVDTVNLSETANRTTTKDVEMIEFLEKFLNIGKAKRSAVFEELITAKSDVSSLNSEQIFRKDLKVVEANNICVAVSSVPLLVKKYLQRENIDVDLQNISESYNYDIIVLMGIDVSGEVERDLAVLSVYLLKGKDGHLELEVVEIQLKNINLFNQKNRTASRKIVLPLIKDWLETK
ncbi:Protein prune-like protein [Armadillidium vulgare]|nr:Protein prune-like protein [Armadillidium vulgare]